MIGLAGLSALAQMESPAGGTERQWVLSNGWIESEFQLTASGRFEFKRLTDLRNGSSWRAPDWLSASPIQLTVDSDTLDSETQFVLAGEFSEEAPPGGQRQVILLEDQGGLGTVRLELELYPNQPVLRYRVRFVNRQPHRVWVHGADMLSWWFDDNGGHYRTLWVNQWVKAGQQGNFEPIEKPLDRNGNFEEVQSGARGQHCGWLALRDQADHGLFAGWEFDGRANAHVRQFGLAQYLELSAAVLWLNQPLEADEEFAVPYAFVGVFQGDWDEAGYRTQRFAEAVLAKPAPDPENFPYVAWDSFGYDTKLDEATLRRNAEMAAKIGVELFVLDLGWAKSIGDWVEDPRKFPSGLRALSDYVHSLGMKFGLHFPLAEAAQDAPVLRQNPDWTSSESYSYYGARSLCLSHQPVKEWIVREAVRMIDAYQLDWILQDGENMVKNCTKTTHTHDPFNSNYANAVDGINAVVAAVQQKRPDTHWENCEDGGSMMTFNMVKNYVTSIAADTTSALASRQSVYGVTYPFPPRYSDRYMSEQKLDTYATRSFMFGGPWIFMNRLAQMDPEQLAFAASEIAAYKVMRARIRRGKVFHLTARPDEGEIDAIQGYDEGTDSAVAVVTRGRAPRSSFTLRLRGLDPQSLYRVRFQTDRRELVRSGGQLMEAGVRVTLPDILSAEVVFVDPQ